MEKYFNTEGRCRQEIHYMVNLDDRLDRMKRLFVDRGKYFVINRGRQYGKTTTLMALAEYIANDYVVLSLDFQMLSSANFADEVSFVISFIEYLEDLLSAKEELRKSLDAEACQELHALKNGGRVSMAGLFRGLSRICGTAEKPVVLMIDEVDSATNYHVFLDFLAMLRGYFLNRENRPAFHSVILAGVYDIKNLKLKLRPDEEHQYNSPWNIAAEFDIEMSFSNVQIAAMLTEYETDHKTGMNVSEVADEIYQYTSGYPYLTSLICKMLDEKLPGNEEILGMDSVWCREGLTEAVKLILKSSVPLFDSMVKQLDAFQDLRDMIEKILYHGKKIPFSPD
ncbi:MAG: ATP-binding protein, partial [Lachnospiraceae bacterium]|nr:ATP-binding protein [Lachnospiraceae bacterium]